MFCTGITNCILSQIQIVSSLMFYQEGPGETVQEGDSYLKYRLELQNVIPSSVLSLHFFVLRVSVFTQTNVLKPTQFLCNFNKLFKLEL